MFIIVEQDILESVIDAPHDLQVRQVLVELSLAVSRGKHYVFIPAWPIFCDKLQSLLSDHTFKILNSLKRQDGHTLSQAVEKKLIVTNKCSEDSIGENIVFSPSIDPSFEIYEETHLLCENINEKLFYEKVEAYYRRNYVTNYTFDNRFNVLPRNGGGASSESVLKAEKHMGNHLLLVIADSDYKYCIIRQENGNDIIDKGDKGTTAAALESIQSDHPYKFGYLYVLEEASEVENLIPKKFLKDLHPNNDKQAIALIETRDIEYLDIKEGIRIVNLFNNKAFDYWESTLNDFKFDTEKIKNIIKTYGSKKKYKEYLKGCNNVERKENIIIDGWGNNILENSLNTKETEYYAITSVDLTPAQQKEWEKIGKLLFEWGLASHPLLR